MTNSQKLTVGVAVVIGLLFVGIAVLYWTQPASALPGFLPGHDPSSPAHHHKHSLGALALGIVCFLIAWFQSGPKTPQNNLPA